MHNYYYYIPKFKICPYFENLDRVISFLNLKTVILYHKNFVLSILFLNFLLSNQENKHAKSTINEKTINIYNFK